MGGDPRSDLPEHDPLADERWRGILMADPTHAPGLIRLRRIFRHLPSDPRCKLCYAPYAAPFGPIVGALGFGRWHKNPSLCGSCLRIMERAQGGAEVDLSMLFADLRGSTELAARMTASAYGKLLNRFYGTAASVIEERGGSIDKYLGDGIFALFIPGFSGPDHAGRAIDAGRQLLLSVATRSAEGGPLPVGIGVHTGTAYVGVVGRTGELTDFTALGDPVNVTARLSSAAAAGELLLSDAVLRASGHPSGGLTRREVTLKGVAGPVTVWSETIGPTGETGSRSE
jgi:adenylate cyclase